MENGKHKTNSFDSLNSWSKKTNLLSSFQGGAGGRLSYSLPFREGPGVGFSPRQAQLILKISVPSVSGVSSVSFRFWTKKTPVFGPNRNKIGVSGVSSVPHPYSLPFREGSGGRLFPLTKREAWLTLFHIGVLCDARFALTIIIRKKSVSKKVAIRR